MAHQDTPDEKELQEGMDELVRDGILSVDGRGGYSLTEKGIRFNQVNMLTKPEIARDYLALLVGNPGAEEYNQKSRVSLEILREEFLARFEMDDETRANVRQMPLKGFGELLLIEIGSRPELALVFMRVLVARDNEEAVG